MSGGGGRGKGGGQSGGEGAEGGERRGETEMEQTEREGDILEKKGFQINVEMINRATHEQWMCARRGRGGVCFRLVCVCVCLFVCTCQCVCV